MTAKICSQHAVLETEIIGLVEQAINKLPKPIEERDEGIKFRDLITEINFKYNEDLWLSERLNRSIKKLDKAVIWMNYLEITMIGLTVLAGVVGLAQNITKDITFQLVDVDKDAQTAIIVTFAVTMAFFVIFSTGVAVTNWSVKRCYMERNKYKELTWEEKKDLKRMVELFNELTAISSETSNSVLKNKFKGLLDSLPTFPTQIEDKLILNKREDLISYMILSLPKDHLIRKKFEKIESFVVNPDAFDEKELHASPVDTEDEESSSQSGQGPSMQWQPEPTKSERAKYQKIVDLYIKKKQKEGQGHKLEKEEEEDLKKNYCICNDWLDIEEFLGREIPHILVHKRKIKSKQIFCKVDHDTFLRNTTDPDFDGEF